MAIRGCRWQRLNPLAVSNAAIRAAPSIGPDSICANMCQYIEQPSSVASGSPLECPLLRPRMPAGSISPSDCRLKVLDHRFYAIISHKTFDRRGFQRDGQSAYVVGATPAFVTERNARMLCRGRSL